MTDRFLALDAGNSKTVAVVVDGHGAILGRGRGGRGDIYNAASPEAATAAVFGAVARALDEAGAEPRQLRGAAFRIAGVDWPEDTVWWRERIGEALPDLARFAVANDGFASLRLGMLDGVGLAVTVGTGPAIAARSRDGREACSGWWVFDDLGGSALARSGLAAVHRAWMGLGPATALTDALLRLFGASDPYELHHSFTRRFGARPEAEKLRATRVVLEVAEAGDPVAIEIVRGQARSFADYAGWVAGQVGGVPGPDFPIVLNGSVATSEHGVLRRALLTTFAERFDGCPVTVATAPPLTGCVLDALAEGGVPLTPELRERVLANEHPTAFLAT